MNQSPEYLAAYNTWFEAQLSQHGQWKWSENHVDAILTDVSSNATARFERLNDFFASIDAPYLGDGNLMKMFEMGFETPESIIELTLQDVGSLVGSAAMGKKIHTGLRAKLTNIPLYVLMGSHHAFGRGVGVRKMKKLFEAFQGDMTKCSNVVNIMQVDGFEHKTASKIAAGYDAFMEFFRKIEPHVTLAKYEPKKEGALSGKSVVVTGFRDAALEKMVEELGGKVSSSVSKQTLIVVAADPTATSTKLSKARDLSIQIMSKDEFLATL